MRVSIVGGGISGSVLGVALRRAGIDATVYEGRSTHDAGAWLTVMPNGVRALNAIGIGRVLDAGSPCDEIVFNHGDGHRIGRQSLRSRGDRAVAIRRDTLLTALHRELYRSDIPVQFNKRVRHIDSDRTSATTFFADGTSARADVVIGCDGINSRIRSFVVGSAISPGFTRAVAVAGSANIALPPTSSLAITFGADFLFGHVVAAPDAALWFRIGLMSTSASPAVQELTEAWKQELKTMHRNDPEPIRAILSAPGLTGVVWPLHDLEALSRWHNGRVCLAGDAAHTITPHGGLGASLAIEDALILAKCLRDLNQPTVAFAAFESIRKPRIDKLVRNARRIGSRRLHQRGIARWLSQRLAPLVLKAKAPAISRAYAYDCAWDREIETEVSHRVGF
jgi:2-polyprenyl-6-methoxyphenol hydroxylase-like FAD-dependent oxidoreductase